MSNLINITYSIFSNSSTNPEIIYLARCYLELPDTANSLLVDGGIELHAQQRGHKQNWVSQLKKDIRGAQVKAAIKVNTELLRLYWCMGADICEKQKSASWGDGWLKELSRELVAEVPDMRGFSYRNLQYIRQWYVFYNKRFVIVQQVVAQLGDANKQLPATQI